MTHNTGYDSAYVYQKTDYYDAQNGRYIITAATIAHFPPDYVKKPSLTSVTLSNKALYDF